MDLLLEKKKQVLVAQLSELASASNEETLNYELSLFFQQVKENVLHELNEYWPNDDAVLLQGQLDLILAPIFESQQQYCNILRKYNIKEYRLGVKQGRRLVKMANKPLSSFKSEQTRIKANNLLNIGIEKDELFGTNDWTQQKLLDQSFTASERTMNRVDQDINQLLSEGYKSGAGIKKVAADIETRFNQLKTWEAKRIARTEIHNAHQMGMINSYNELGVEYVQWISAHDKRVRLTHRGSTLKHKGVDGEIIPLGALFSNGLEYPGDTKGPLEEWINCRCSLVPFIIPDGFMAPSFSPFREKDLIPTLDYWNQDELITQATQDLGIRQAELYKVPIKESLIENKFAIPTEDLSEFGISNDGLKTIQQIQKRNFGEHKEFGFRFDEKTGKILSDEFEGTGKYVDIPPSKSGKYSTIHNHTDDSLSAPSADDFYTYFTRKRENVAVNISRNDTWIIKVDRNVFNYKKVETICQNVYDVEVKQIKKLKKEYKILKKEVKQGKRTKEDLDRYLANDFNKKHNSELEKNLLDVLSDVKGLKVKRIVNNTKINPKSVPKLQNIKTVKPNGKSKGIRKAPEIKKDPKKVVKIGDDEILGIEESKEARDAFEKKYGVTENELTKDEFDFIRLYSGDGFSHLNTYLRLMNGVKNPWKKWKLFRYYSKLWDKSLKGNPHYMSMGKAIRIGKKVYNKAKILEEDLVVVRRQDKPLLEYSDGEIYNNYGYLSTSISGEKTEYGEYVAYIRIPKGEKILYIESVTATEDEFEVLISPGTKINHLKNNSKLYSEWTM